MRKRSRLERVQLTALVLFLAACLLAGVLIGALVIR